MKISGSHKTVDVGVHLDGVDRGRSRSDTGACAEGKQHIVNKSHGLREAGYIHDLKHRSDCPWVKPLLNGGLAGLNARCSPTYRYRS
jgi:hypothetical protein